MLNWFIPNWKNNYSPYLLRSTALSIYTLLLLGINLLGGAFDLGTVQASTITRANIIQLTNAERGKYGLISLRESSRLNAAAIAKANNMFEEQYWDHFGPKGETPWQFIKNAGYAYVFAGENLAKGFKSSEGVVQAWMASPTHRENILSGNYQEIGIATVDGILLGESVTLVVQMFGNTSSNTTPSAPSIPKPVEKPIEKGETKSIKITYPLNNSTVTDPSFSVKGEVNKETKDYSVELYDGKKILGKLSTNGNLWEFSRNSDWTEGNHNVSAVLSGESPAVKDTVQFTVDSVPPQIRDSDIMVVSESDGWIIDVITEEENPEISVVVGSKTYSSSFTEGLYRVVLDEVESGEKVVLIASDQFGNTVEIEITDRFEENEGSVMGGFLNSINIKNTVNTVFVIFIFILLLMEITVYVRKGLIKEKRGSLFSMIMWWSLLLVGTLNGFGGTIV